MDSAFIFAESDVEGGTEDDVEDDDIF